MLFFSILAKRRGAAALWTFMHGLISARVAGAIDERIRGLYRQKRRTVNYFV